MKIYLDTSALIKLYIIEDGSVLINTIVSDNAAPLPIWDLHIIEFHNALKLKVFRDELNEKEALHLSLLFKERKKAKIYYTPELDREDHTELCISYTAFTAEIGCRSLDIMHVAAASIFRADRFLTFDVKQAELADKAGLDSELLEGVNGS
ncbi:MAG: type II toxin-antitoxin system VapC family toxin [Spirochaetia bacterium]